MEKYDDIIHLPHPVSEFRKPMDMRSRAAQFAPFAALSGHEEAICETGRYVSQKIQLTPEEQRLISTRLSLALVPEMKIEVSIRYFVADRSKPGGFYRTIRGFVHSVDMETRQLHMNDSVVIPLDDISEIEVDM